MERELRTAIGSTAQNLRRLLETEYLEQLEGTYDIHGSGKIEDTLGAHLTPRERVTRSKIVGAIQYLQSCGLDDSESVGRFVRDAAFTTLNRFVALKMLEARELVQQCISDGGDSTGYREFIGLAPGIERLSEGAGYRLYLESLFDELATEIKVLFDRRDSASLLWPRHNAFVRLLNELNRRDLGEVWDNDETIGWFYQFFNSREERQQMRDESQAPRNGRELAVRNQFFTPRYVVQFLVDNTLGRTWVEMAGSQTELASTCEYLVDLNDERPGRPLKDPRDFRILDPACGSGHFLLYSFDLLERMYREAWEHSLRSEGQKSLRETYPSMDELLHNLPRLVLEENLWGVDLDPRAAQIASLALWLRAQRSWRDAGISAADRPKIKRTGIVVAEPMPGDADMVNEFAASLSPPLLSQLFKQIVASMALTGELGTLVRAEAALVEEIHRARAAFVSQRIRPQSLPGFELEARHGELDLSGIDDDAFFVEAEQRLVNALDRYAFEGAGAQSARRRLFADDAGQGVALLELLRERFDVVLMNPPFGSGSLKAKKVFDATYPRTKNDVFAAFVERGIQMLVPRGMLGALTSRTGLFLSSFQTWREEVVLEEAPPLVLADLGLGVLDGPLVEVAAYCLERLPRESVRLGAEAF